MKDDFLVLESCMIPSRREWMSRRERKERKGVHTDTKGILVPLVSSAFALALPLGLRILLFCFIDEGEFVDVHDAWYGSMEWSAMV